MPRERPRFRIAAKWRDGPRGDISNPRLGSLRIAHSSLMFAKLEIEQRQRKRRDTTVVAETLEVEAHAVTISPRSPMQVCFTPRGFAFFPYNLARFAGLYSRSLRTWIK